MRVVTGRNQQVARIDYERDTDADGAVQQAVAERAARLGGSAQALLVSDYLKGAITRPVIEALLALTAPLVVDPKIPHLACYAGASLITPNHHEAEVATHRRIRTDDDAREAARAFRTRAECDAVLITRGEHGMWLSSADAEGAIPAASREVSDVTGAGDTVVATLALALAAGATLVEASVLANHAAGIVVGKFGPATVSPERAARRDRAVATAARKASRYDGQNGVYTSIGFTFPSRRTRRVESARSSGRTRQWPRRCR